MMMSKGGARDVRMVELDSILQITSRLCDKSSSRLELLSQNSLPEYCSKLSSSEAQTQLHL